MGVVIIGAGIVGLATAKALASSADPQSITVVEKETTVGQHQSGRNSGVLHSGIYYRPGSRKARHCRAGKALMEEFCQRERIPVVPSGKLIMAITQGEAERLPELVARGRANGVVCQLLTEGGVARLEPRAKAVAALHVPETSVVDFRQVTQRLADRLESAGIRILRGRRVTGLRELEDHVIVRTAGEDMPAAFVVNCAGLYSDRLLRSLTGSAPARIIPFRGEYYRLGHPSREGLSGRCLYPFPDPGLPFLGVHLTPTVAGDVLCGPNAVLALAREGYGWRRIRLKDLLEIVSYPGFLRLAGRYWRTGVREMARSASPRLFAGDVNRLVEGVHVEDLAPWPAGVRAQAITRSGQLVDDFVFGETRRSLHVIHSPSPAATASLSLGEEIAGRVRRQMASL